MTMTCTGFRLGPRMEIDPSGELQLDGVSLSRLAAEHGTPLYVLSEGTVRENCRRYQNSLAAAYPDFVVAYASKAFLCQAMCQIIAQEGLWLDVVSGGELYTALSSTFPPERIIFHGVSRSPDELHLAITSGVGRIVVDNWAELERVERVARELERQPLVWLRLNSGVEAHTHHYVQTSLLDSKFGFQLEEAGEVVKRYGESPYLRIVGLHCHIGSQILSLEPFLENLRIMLEKYAALLHLGCSLSELNLGGGLGTYYTDGDVAPQVEQLTQQLAQAALQLAEELGIRPPRLILEPGRSIVNDAGLTLYRITGSKLIPGVRKYLFIDGGMSDNIRPALYGSRYSAALANRMDRPAEELVTIAGRCCESGDVLLKDVWLPASRPGDLLVIARTGAYNYSMASNYNRLPRPAVVLVNQGVSHVIVKRETYYDLIRLDAVPDHLR